MSNSTNTILIVEDDPNDILLIKRAFQKASVRNPLQTVSNGEEAVMYLLGQGKYEDKSLYPTPSLLLVDLKIPRKSGFEVIEWIKKQPQLKKLLVVILTSSKETHDIDRAYDLGANSYLVKPVTFKELEGMVKRLDQYWLKLNVTPEIH